MIDKPADAIKAQLREQLRTMLLASFEKEVYWEDVPGSRGEEQYPVIIPPADFVVNLEARLDVILNADIFDAEVELLEIYWIYKLHHTEDLDDNYSISIILLEKNTEIPALLKTGCGSYNYNISPVYMDSLRKKSLASMPFKDNHFFREKPQLTINYTEFHVNYNDWISETEVNRLCFVYFKNLENAQHNALIKQFIRSKECSFLLMNDLNYIETSTQYVTLKGVRIYKIPDVDYTDDLNKIRQFKRLFRGFNTCERFLNLIISLEVSVDNYLEIYATTEGLEFFFMKQLFSFETGDDLFFYSSHYDFTYGDEQGILLPYVVGSTKNKIICGNGKLICIP